MYAIVDIAGFQFRAEEGATLRVPSLGSEPGASVDLNRVMLVKSGDNAHIGTPFVDGASVSAEIVASGRREKTEIYKYKRRTKYRRRQGHRQGYTDIKVTKIVAP